MKKMRKLSALLLVMVLVLTSFTACGKKNDTKKDPSATNAPNGDGNTGTPEKVTLKVWGPQEEQTPSDEYKDGLLAYMCNEFAKAHPEYDITFQYGVVSEGDCLTELQKDAAAAGDVFMFASDQIGKMVEADLLYPITKNVEEVKANNTEASVDAATIDGQVYAYPFTPNSWFMYYNTSMYTEEDVKSLETMLAKDLGDGVKNFACDITDSWYLSAYFFANGCHLFGADGTDPKLCDFNNEKGVEVGNYLVDLAKNKKFMDIQDNNDIPLMKEGKLAATCTGTWNATNIKEALGDNYAAVKLPTININGQDQQISSFSSYKLIGVNTQTKAPLAALALADYLAGEECQQLRYDVRTIAPTNVKLASATDMDPAVKALNDQSEVSTLQPSIPQMANYWAPAQAFGEALISGEVTKDNMQSKLDDLVHNILASLE